MKPQSANMPISKPLISAFDQRHIAYSGASEIATAKKENVRTTNETRNGIGSTLRSDMCHTRYAASTVGMKERSPKVRLDAILPTTMTASGVGHAMICSRVPDQRSF